MQHSNSKKPIKVSARPVKIQKAKQMDMFAEYLADGLSPSEAAFRSGAKRCEGADMLSRLRRSVGLYQAK